MDKQKEEKEMNNEGWRDMYKLMGVEIPYEEEEEEDESSIYQYD